VQKQLGVASDSDQATLAQLQQQASHRNDGTRDLAGMRKQLILATASGKLFSLHSGNGRVLWHTFVESQGLPLMALKLGKLPHKAAEDVEVLFSSWLMTIPAQMPFSSQ
jgi:ER membrane protein complex subunit 1